MHLALRSVLSLSILTLFACAPEAPDEAPVDVARQDLTARGLAALFSANVSTARARCLLRSLVVGAADANAQPTIDTTLTVQPAQGALSIIGCGAQAVVAPAQGDARAALRDDLSAISRGAVATLTELARASGDDQPAVQFTSALPRTIDAELPFDGYERADAVVQLARLSLDDATRELAPLTAPDLAQGGRLVGAQAGLLERLALDTFTLAERTRAQLEVAQQ
ncbi:MAG: hypothetical protein JNM17_18390 [Archangium sp.]|nr:hypothetical protein [Archangium sp.]